MKKNIILHANPIIMKQLLLTFIFTILVTSGATAQYSIHSCSGDVKIKKGMRLIPAEKRGNGVTGRHTRTG